MPGPAAVGAIAGSGGAARRRAVARLAVRRAGGRRGVAFRPAAGRGLGTCRGGPAGRGRRGAGSAGHLRAAGIGHGAIREDRPRCGRWLPPVCWPRPLVIPLAQVYDVGRRLWQTQVATATHRSSRRSFMITAADLKDRRVAARRADDPDLAEAERLKARLARLATSASRSTCRATSSSPSASGSWRTSTGGPPTCSSRARRSASSAPPSWPSPAKTRMPALSLRGA